MNWLKRIWKGFSEPLPPYKPSSSSASSPGAKPRIFRYAHSEEAMNNFTPRAQQVLALSRKQADRFNHNFVGTEHLLLGLIALGQGTAVNVLQKLGVDLETVRMEVETQVGTGPDQKMIGHIPYTPRVKKVLTLASKEAKSLNHTYVGTEHILLGLLLEGDGVAARVLKSLGVNLEQTRAQVLKELDPDFGSTENAAETLTAGQSAADSSPPDTARTVAARPQIDGIDLTKRYDVYCSERLEQVVVYRSVLFKGIKKLFREDNDRLMDFLELEQADGQTVFVAKYSVIKFCAPGATPNAEDVPGKQP